MTDEGASSWSCGEGAAPLGALLAEAASILADAGVEQSRREARLLVAHALGLTAEELLRLPRDRPVPSGHARQLVRRRAAREPLAFITGHRGFWTLDLLVSPATLIPRADTETLIEAALARRPDRTGVRTLLDLGCGTGALLLAALVEYPEAFGVGVDRVEAACRLARENARRNGLADRTALLCADWSDALEAPPSGFDLILCNPPYIGTAEISRLMPEVAAYEPRLALDGGPDGLAAYRGLMPRLRHLLSRDGIAVIEVGAGQDGVVTDLAGAAGLAISHHQHDFGGMVRALVLECSNHTP